jgi:TctA family transporter
MTIAIISHSVLFLAGLYVGARYGERLRGIWYDILSK